MGEQLHGNAIAAKEGSSKWLSSPVGAIVTGSSDIGQAELEDGSTVHITWGRNIDKEAQDWYLENTVFKPIYIGASDGLCELVIPDSYVNEIMGVRG